MSMKINGVSLGFNGKKYSHNKSRDCNTTFPIGVTQPIFTEYMLPDSDISVKAKQLVRLAPLVSPTFARLFMKTVTRFVPEHDVVPYADAFYSQQSYHGSVPSKLPFTNNPTLVAYLLSISNLTVWKSASPSPTAVSWSDAAKLLPYFYSRFVSVSTEKVETTVFPIDSRHYVAGTAIPTVQTPYQGVRPVSYPDTCDYLVMVDDGSSTYPYLFCFSFGVNAKNFRNICLGLGYSLDMDDFTPVRFSPLLSYYKAYFDTYGIVRDKNFTQTSCYGIINGLIDALVQSDFTNVVVGSGSAAATRMNLLLAFFKELSECYYSTDSDFVSIHRTQPNVGTFPSTSFSNTVTSSVTENVITGNNSLGSYTQSNSFAIYQSSLDLLKRLSRFVSKTSLLGRRVSKYMELHFGASSVSSLFADSNFVDSSTLPLQINDVFSTSDTFDSENYDGKVLGSFAGKGIGFGELSFKYHAPCHGYLITLAAIVPHSGYWQGNSCDLFALDWQSQPSSDFDAVGMELTPRSAFISHNDISLNKTDSQSDLTNKGFGFVPRFSGFKFSKNVANGDMSRRGTISDMSTYFLDHIITSNQCNTVVASGKVNYNFVTQKVPSTNALWRYVNKYPWLGNYLRIFSNEVGLQVNGSYLPTPSGTYQYDAFCINDSFISQIAFDCTVRNCLKPLSLSYDTFDDDVDNNSKTVDPA